MPIQGFIQALNGIHKSVKKTQSPIEFLNTILKKAFKIKNQTIKHAINGLFEHVYTSKQEKLPGAKPQWGDLQHFPGPPPAIYMC